MNIRKATSVVADPSKKSEFQYFVELTKKAQELLNCVEAIPGHRSLLIMTKTGDTYTYSWDGCKHMFSCKYVHNNKCTFGHFTKSHAATFIADDLYNQAEWKLI